MNISCHYRTPKIVDAETFDDLPPSSFDLHRVPNLESENTKMIDLAKDFYPNNSFFLTRIMEIMHSEDFLKCPEKMILKDMLEAPLVESKDPRSLDIRDLARVFVAMKMPSFKQKCWILNL